MTVGDYLYYAIFIVEAAITLALFYRLTRRTRHKGWQRRVFRLLGLAIILVLGGVLAIVLTPKATSPHPVGSEVLALALYILFIAAPIFGGATLGTILASLRR